jgi:hypothetical protein
LQVDDVAGDECGHVHHDGVAASHGQRTVADLRVQRLGGLLRPVLVDEPQPHRQRQDHPDDHGVAAFPDEIRRDRRRQQQPQQRGAQLMPQHQQQPRPVRGHRVGPVPGQPPRRLPWVQTVAAHPEAAQDLLARQRTGRHHIQTGLERVRHGLGGHRHHR